MIGSNKEKDVRRKNRNETALGHVSHDQDDKTIVNGRFASTLLETHTRVLPWNVSLLQNVFYRLEDCFKPSVFGNRLELMKIIKTIFELLWQIVGELIVFSILIYVLK